MVTGQLALRWLASSSASALRAAALVARGVELTDAALRERLGEPARQLADTMAALPGLPEQVWRHMLPLAAGIETDRELATVTLRKACGAAAVETHQQALAGAIGAVERTFRSVYPSAAHDLTLRGKPLRELWEARGPGLLARLRSLTAPDLLVESADIVLVHPVAGGGGDAFLSYNSVHLEALLANPIAELPEVARLAWLLAQLHLDLPRYSERVARTRLPLVAGLALVPAVLCAAEHVELARYDEPSVHRAIEAWIAPDVAASSSTLVMDWWYTYEEARPPLAIALQGLEKMLDQ
jgi:hypothetical protein